MRRIWIRFLSLSRFGQIGVAVLAFHVALILMLLINHAATERPPLRKPIAIRTTLVSSPAVSSKKAVQASPKVTQPPKEIKKALPVKAKPKTSKERKEDHKISAHDQNLLQQIADSLGAISAPTNLSKPAKIAVPLPPSIEIQTGVQDSFARPGYGETVSAILQSSLDLPEFGQVVAKIEIDASGAVTQCEILDARSRKNAEFLKKRLRELAFPCFNEFGLSEKHLNFSITFHNVENR